MRSHISLADAASENSVNMLSTCFSFFSLRTLKSAYPARGRKNSGETPSRTTSAARAAPTCTGLYEDEHLRSVRCERRGFGSLNGVRFPAASSPSPTHNLRFMPCHLVFCNQDSHSFQHKMAKLFLAALPLVAAVAPEQVCALEDGGYLEDSDTRIFVLAPVPLRCTCRSRALPARCLW